MSELIKEKRRKFAKELIKQGIQPEAAQLDSIRRMKFENDNPETTAKIALSQFKKPIMPEEYKHLRHVGSIFEEVQASLEKTMEELKKEGMHPHTSKILLQEVRDDMIHKHEFDPDVTPYKMKESYLSHKVKKLKEKREKQRQEIFGKD